jgi:hypothetical protein
LRRRKQCWPSPAAGYVRCRLLPAEHAAGRMIRVSRYRDIRSIRAIKSLLKVDGNWQAVIGNHFAESCNRFVSFAYLKFRFNSLLGPHDASSVIGRSHRRVSICNRPQILVFVHSERSERRSGGDRHQPCGAAAYQGNQRPRSEPGNGEVPLLANGRYTPESDRLLRCREMTRWARSDHSAPRQKGCHSSASSVRVSRTWRDGEAECWRRQ